jgi:hypothetical protein
MTAVLFIFVVWTLPVIMGASIGIQHGRVLTGILWPLFIGWIGFLIALYLIEGPRKPPPPSHPENHPGYVPGLQDGEL